MVEAGPPPVPVLRDRRGNDNGVLVLQDEVSIGRTNDIQAEAKAMARAADASIYSPELLARQYASRPIKVWSVTQQFNSLFTS